MNQKIFLLRGKSQRTITIEEMEAFDRKINKFHSEHNVKASQVQLLVAFDHICLLETVWFSGDLDEKELTSPHKEVKKGLPVFNGLPGKELGALWHWQRDGTLRGDFREEQLDLNFDYVKDNAEVKKDKAGVEFYILEIKGERCLIFPNIKKEKPNQPDYRIYEG